MNKPLQENGNGANGSVEKFIDLGKLYAIVAKNWLVMKRDTIRLVPLIMFPIIMIMIYGYTTGSPPRHISAAVVDYDNTPTSHEVLSRLYSNDLFSIEHLYGSQDEGRRSIDTGVVKALFIIPPNLENDINAGKTAYISVVVDESEPIIAQTVKASIQVFVQQLSQELTASRLALLTSKSTRAGQAIAQAEATLGTVVDNTGSADASLASATANYRSMSYLSAKTSDMLLSTVAELRNTLSFLIDQNEIATTSPNSYSASSAALQLLAVGDQQQSVLQQIATYGSLEAVNQKMMGGGTKIYVSANSIYGESQKDVQAAKVVYTLVGSAGSQLADIQEASQNAATNPISMLVVEPYGSGRHAIDYLLPSILALIIFQGASMGLGRAIAGERRDGSLTRVFLTPTSNTTIILGTQMFYLLLESVRSCLIILVAIILFNVTISGDLLSILVIIVIYALGTTGVGMVMSVLTRNQEQYMAMAMLISLPTMFLSGVFLPIQTMPAVLQWIAGILPVTYAADALRMVMIKGFPLSYVIPDLIALSAFGVVTVTLSVLLFKRELI
ncbi:hypothetical protein AUJ13_02035 [Candidatus Micrarchaeota archaeon CG1_02_49_24]|nr:MAG: hypothetical protein AUJ13_02035 [Candidatus Micrarchaeota archaeon CG1_02_49_24]HII54362.1 ABC transporter permease [Candidatus Micrarchaeota archaeon]